ncbi:MAG TPA: type II toxin-antitoxin system RelE/ParE family toxin [Casimicrobiaceae bacterium]|jgi:plasmid stabilization system protein ParE|nr:type II toxin-antitoxin system RelE/ParE family toxin [Burkholderiales bacterium]
MRRIRIHAAAAEEVAEAAAWYEKERPGLGAEFEQAVEAALDLLEEELVPLIPVSRAAGARGVKRLLLRRFPYAVIVRADAAEVVVIAFAHTARHPGYWRERLKSAV